MTDRQPLGDLIDSLGVRHTPEPDEMVSDVVVLMKIVDADGGVFLRTAWSEGMSWIERLGMLRAAEATDLPPQGGSWAGD